jgi:acyl dehydratase
MEALEGRTYGPLPLRVCADRVAEFVAATRDDPNRWTDHAPPGWAAACLFAVAPRLLTEPELSGRGVIHGEQRFTWKEPIQIEQDLAVTGTVNRVRIRGGVAFLGFDLAVTRGSHSLLAGSSTFLVSVDSPAAGETPEEPEPESAATGLNDPLPPRGEMVTVRRSASRADLVRYAAASRDWNPIHWDHQAARKAGLPGVVVHGLLQAAWLTSGAANAGTGPNPLTEASFRFRAPLRPTVTCEMTGALDNTAVNSRLMAGGSELVNARLALR